MNEIGIKSTLFTPWALNLGALSHQLSNTKGSKLAFIAKSVRNCLRYLASSQGLLDSART